MALRGSDLVVAVGKELRITSLADTASSSNSGKAYKVNDTTFRNDNAK
jgi:hypothetical protein